MFSRNLMTCLLAAFPLLACGDSDPGKGSVAFSIWGEEYIEQGIPEQEFEDGWSVTFSQFFVVLGDVSVADEDGREAGHIAGTQLFDLAAPGPHEVGVLGGVDARRWNRVGFSIVPATLSTRRHASAAEEALHFMQEGEYSVFVRGEARLSSIARKEFAWGFSHSTDYERCVQVTGNRETPGIIVRDGVREDVEITIHGDHLFYDDLVSEGAKLRFAPFAAADDGAFPEDLITVSELSTVPLASLPEGTYGTGGAADVDDLGAFVRALTTRLGHFRGEGHCAATTR